MSIRPTLSTFNEIGEMFVQEYERYLPTSSDESMSLLEKVNKIIGHLNRIGKVTDDLVKQWNEVMEWLMNGGMTEDIWERIDYWIQNGHFDEIVNPLLEIPITKFGGNVSNAINNKAIQDTINYVSSLGGGSVVIPAGTYYVDGNVPIIMKNNVTIKGVQRDSSILKIKDGNGDWNELFTHNNQWLENVSFINLTMDCNVNNIVNMPVAWSTSRMFINGGEGDNLFVTNCKFITNGIWVFHGDFNNSNISDNEFIWDGKSYTSGWFDVSVWWMGGENNFIHHNVFTTKNSSAFTPETAIEFQGHNFHVHDNICLNYTNGILPTPSTSYDNPIYQLDSFERGIKIYNNTIEASNKGIFIWPMWANDLQNIHIYNNTIYLNGLKKGHSEPNAGIDFKLKTPTWNMTAKLNNIVIKNNYIEFKTRNISESLYSGDTGIKFYVNVSVTGVEIEGNTIKGAGGQGVSLHVDAGSLEFIRHVNIVNNIFKDCRLPVWLSRNLQDILITGNIFQQREYYPAFDQNMVRTIYSVNATNIDNKNFVIRNNTIKCPDELKPYYPVYDLSKISDISSYPYNKGMRLEKSVEDNPMIMEPPKDFKGAITVGVNQWIRRNDGKTYTPSFNYPNTLGKLTGSDGVTKVSIVEWIGNGEIRVSDPTNIKPNMTIALDGANIFTSYVFYVEAVIGDRLFSRAGAGAPLKAGKTASDAIGSILEYYTDLKEVIVSTNGGTFAINGGGFADVTFNHNLPSKPRFANVVPASVDAAVAGIRYIEITDTQIKAYLTNVPVTGVGNLKYSWWAEL